MSRAGSPSPSKHKVDSSGSPLGRLRGRTGATIYTKGRPPWYNVSGEVNRSAFVIGIAGGTASGKTTVADKIIESLAMPWCCLVSQDSFYKVLGKEDLEKAHNNDYDFDHPSSIDLDLLADTLTDLKAGKRIELPIYSFTTHSREDETVPMYGANVIILEGLFVLATERLRDLLDVKIFVDEDPDIRLSRRMTRDIAERGRSISGVIQQYNRFVKPNFDKHIKPTMQHADLVIPRGAKNTVAMSLLVKHLNKQLAARGIDIRRQLASAQIDSVLPPTVKIPPITNQIRGLHTIIRNKDTLCEDFVFHSERLMRILLEFTLSFLEHEDYEIETVTGQLLRGRRPSGRIVAVTVLRAGLSMEGAIRSVLKDVEIGRLLIQTNRETHEPELHYCSLPADIAECQVVIVDPTMATGASAMMAVRVLLDHEVPQDKIFVDTLVAAPLGVHTLAYAFPDVRICASSVLHPIAVDKEINENFHILPGVGDFGDRYFGTDERIWSKSRQNSEAKCSQEQTLTNTTEGRIVQNAAAQATISPPASPMPFATDLDSTDLSGDNSDRAGKEEKNIKALLGR